MTNKEDKSLKQEVNCLKNNSTECICMTEEEIKKCEEQIDKQ